MIAETEAVVLHAMPYGDTSKIVTLYTKRYGKLKVIAKGARGEKNKFGASMEPLSVSSVILYKKEHRDLHLLSKSETVLPLHRIQQDTDRLFTGLALIELTAMVMHDEHEDAGVYALLVDSLRALDAADRNAVNVLLTYTVKLFGHFGFGLDLSRCAVCGRDVTAGELPFVLLRSSDGTVICDRCHADGQTNGQRIDGGAFRSLQFFRQCAVGSCTSLTLPPAAKDRILTALQTYLQYHVEGARTLRSLSLLYTATEQRPT